MAFAKKRNGSWRGTYVDPEGRERSKSFRTKAEALDWAKAREIAIKRGEWVDPDRLRTPFRDYATLYMAEKPLARQSRDNYDSDLRNHILPALGGLALGEITKTHLVGLVRRLEERLAPNTVEKTYGITRSILNAAVEDGYLVKAPGRVRLAHRQGDDWGRSVRPVEIAEIPTVKEVQRLVEVAPPIARGITVVAATTGLRQGEILGLRRPSVVFLGEPRIHVVEQIQTPQRGEPYFCRPKTRRGRRTVPLGSWPAEAIAEHLATYPIAAAPGTEGEPPIFRTASGAMWRRSRFGEVWRSTRKAAGLPHLKFHGLRHFYASMLIADGHSRYEVADLLGHTPRETEETYLHLWHDHNDRARSTVDRHFPGRRDSRPLKITAS